MTSDDRPGAGDSYGALIRDQLAEARDSKSSLERRGLAVITSSGTLVTALLAIAALVTRRTDFELSDGAAIQLTIAAALLLVAASAAVLTNAPRRYDEISDETLKKMVSERGWYAGSDEAARIAAQIRQEALAAARGLNRQKAVVLLIAMGCEVTAVLFLASAVATILL